MNYTIEVLMRMAYLRGYTVGFEQADKGNKWPKHTDAWEAEKGALMAHIPPVAVTFTVDDLPAWSFAFDCDKAAEWLSNNASVITDRLTTEGNECISMLLQIDQIERVDEDFTSLWIDPEDLEILLFPMRSDGDDTTSAIADRQSEVDHYDVILREQDGDPIKEWENLDEEQAERKFAELCNMIPAASSEDLRHMLTHDA